MWLCKVEPRSIIEIVHPGVLAAKVSDFGSLILSVSPWFSQSIDDRVYNTRRTLRLPTHTRLYNAEWRGAYSTILVRAAQASPDSVGFG